MLKEKKFIFLFFILILFFKLSFAYEWNEFKDGSWILDDNGIIFLVNKDSYHASPEKIYENTFSAGDAFIKLFSDSCGNPRYTPILNPYTCSIGCSCGGASHTCSDSASADYECDRNTKDGSCRFSYYVKDGGYCSCHCKDTGCTNCSECCCGSEGTCSSCKNSQSNSGFWTASPVDTTQLDGECLSLSIFKLNYKKAEKGTFNIKWYREPDISIDVTDNCHDLDEVIYPSFEGYITKPDFNIVKVGSNTFRINFKADKNKEVEDLFDLDVPLKDKDLCMETTTANLIFAIDNLGPEYIKIDSHPLNYQDNIPNLAVLEDVFNANYLKEKFNLKNVDGKKEQILAIKGLSYCKFKKDPCLVFHILDGGVGIKELYVKDDIGLGKPKYSIEDSSVKLSLEGVEGTTNSKKIKVSYSKSSKSFTLQGKDKLDNIGIKIHILLPFDTPKSQCFIKKIVNGYTNFPFISCNISSTNNILNQGYIYYTIDENKNINNVSLKFSNNLYIENIEPTRFYSKRIKKNTSLDIIKNRKLFNNVDLVYFTIDDFLNAENVFDFDSNNLIAYLRPNKLHVNLDLVPPNVYISSNEIISDGEELNDVNVNELEGEELKFKELPAHVHFKCKDPGSGKCTVNITLSNGEKYQIKNEGDIIINDPIGFINLVFYDDLKNIADPVTLNFKLDLTPPDISIKFDKKPISKGSSYYFIEDTTLTVNASVKNDIKKIKKICLKINDQKELCSNSYVYSKKLSCELGKRCEYNIQIKAISNLNVESIKNIKVVIDKNPFKVILNIVDPKTIYKKGITYLSNKINWINTMCYLKEEFHQEGKVVSVELKACDKKGNCQILYQNNSLNEKVFLKIKKYKINLKQGNLSLTCVFDSKGTIVKKIEYLSYYIDEEPPVIDKLLINGQDYSNQKEIMVNSNTLNITVLLVDKGVGIKQSKSYFEGEEFSFKDYLNIKKTINIDGIYELKIFSEDEFGRKLNKIFKIIMDNSPPTLSWQVLKKVGNKVIAKFTCIDFPTCYITKAECNGKTLFNGKVNSITLECSFSEDKPLTEWYFTLEDKKNNLYNYGPVQIEGILKKFDLEILPNLEGEIFCGLNSYIPLFLRIYNYLSDEDVKVNTISNSLVIMENQNFVIKRNSFTDLIAFIPCITKQTIDIKFNISYKEGNRVLEKKIKVVPISFS
jgi:hypothetical protein